jgi:hypothetical protein
MRPRDADCLSPFDQLGEGNLAGDDSETKLTGSLKLGVICWDRSRHDQGSNPGKVGRVVPLGYADSQGGQVGCARRFGIAPADRDPTAARDERECAHPRSAYSHEVDSALIRGAEQCHVE